MTYTAPEHINLEHKIDLFDCGEVTLNNWLKERALESESSGAARAYVVCSDNRVVGYYCLSTGSIIRSQAPGKIRRNMPDPIPVIIVGRIAVVTFHGIFFVETGGGVWGVWEDGEESGRN